MSTEYGVVITVGRIEPVEQREDGAIERHLIDRVGIRRTAFENQNYGDSALNRPADTGSRCSH